MELGLELIIIFLLATFQAMFGVGLLLFGTPIFLLIRNAFVSPYFIYKIVNFFFGVRKLIYLASDIDVIA